MRGILEGAGRGDDYLEISLGGAWQWNPLDDPLLDTYSLAYSVASLINQLFGKSRELFWQQAYTNLVRWIIELHRLLPGGWVTLQDIYRCTIDAELFGRKIGAARDLVARLCPVRVTVAGSDLFTHKESLEDWAWEPVAGTEKATCRLDPGLSDRLAELERPVRDRGERGRRGQRAQGAGRGDRALVPERLDGARCQAPHLDRGRHLGLPLALRSAASREHVLSAASGPGRIHTYV